MKKIKLTESQVKRLQNIEFESSDKKTLKITLEQYNRLFNKRLVESSESEFLKSFKKGAMGESETIGPKSSRPSNIVTNNFKNASKNIPDSNLKFEMDSEYIPQTELENEKTHDSFNESINKVDRIDIIDFGKHVIDFLKNLLSDPNDERIDNFWKDLNLSKKNLTDKMFDIHMIGYGLIDGKKIFKILRHNFEKNIKKLYDDLVPTVSIESDNSSHDKIKNDFKQQLKRKDGVDISPEDIRKKIAQKRSEELKRRERENQQSLGELDNSNLPAGADNHLDAPWNQNDNIKQGLEPKEHMFDLVFWFQENAIFERDGKYYLFNVDSVDNDDYAEYADREEMYYGRDEDGFPDTELGDWDMDESIINNYVNDNYKSLSFGKGYEAYENGVQMVEMDQNVLRELMSLAPYIKNPNERQEFMEILGGLSLDEETTASSSGSYVSNTDREIYTKYPSDEIKQVVGEIDNDNEDKTALIKDLKYKNFQHPALGIFYLNSVKHKNETDDKLNYSISLKNENNKISDSELLYVYDKNTKKDKLFFNHEGEQLHDAYTYFDELYSLVFDGIKDVLKPKSELDEVTTASSSGSYVQPKIWAKDKENMRFGKKPMYPQGKIVKSKVTESDDNKTKTAYPRGEFVKLDNCTKLNNNKKAQNGGCSTGSVDNVITTQQTSDSIISDDSLYSEVAKKTGRSLAEVKKIIQAIKG